MVLNIVDNSVDKSIDEYWIHDSKYELIVLSLLMSTWKDNSRIEIKYWSTIMILPHYIVLDCMDVIMKTIHDRSPSRM